MEEKEGLNTLYNQGLEHSKKGEWHEAIRCFIEVVTQDPDYTKAADKLEEARRQQALEIAYKQGLKYLGDANWPGATAKFSEVIAVDAEYRDASEKLNEALKQWELERLYDETLKLLDQKDWGQTVERLEKIVYLEPSYRDAEAKLQEARHEYKPQNLNLYEDGIRHSATHAVDPDLLVSLSDAELQALADSVLGPRQQERLSDLLRRNRDEGLSADEERELDRLLERVDQMNVLKARAIYTLQQRSKSEA